MLTQNDIRLFTQLYDPNWSMPHFEAEGRNTSLVDIAKAAIGHINPMVQDYDDTRMAVLTADHIEVSRHHRIVVTYSENMSRAFVWLWAFDNSWMPVTLGIEDPFVAAEVVDVYYHTIIAALVDDLEDFDALAEAPDLGIIKDVNRLYYMFAKPATCSASTYYLHMSGWEGCELTTETMPCWRAKRVPKANIHGISINPKVEKAIFDADLLGQEDNFNVRISAIKFSAPQRRGKTIVIPDAVTLDITPNTATKSVFQTPKQIESVLIAVLRAAKSDFDFIKAKRLQDALNRKLAEGRDWWLVPLDYCQDGPKKTPMLRMSCDVMAFSNSPNELFVRLPQGKSKSTGRYYHKYKFDRGYKDATEDVEAALTAAVRYIIGNYGIWASGSRALQYDTIGTYPDVVSAMGYVLEVLNNSEEGIARMKSLAAINHGVSVDTAEEAMMLVLPDKLQEFVASSTFNFCGFNLVKSDGNVLVRRVVNGFTSSCDECTYRRWFEADSMSIAMQKVYGPGFKHLNHSVCTKHHMVLDADINDMLEDLEVRMSWLTEHMGHDGHTEFRTVGGFSRRVECGSELDGSMSFGEYKKRVLETTAFNCGCCRKSYTSGGKRKMERPSPSAVPVFSEYAGVQHMRLKDGTQLELPAPTLKAGLPGDNTGTPTGKLAFMAGHGYQVTLDAGTTVSGVLGISEDWKTRMLTDKVGNHMVIRTDKEVPYRPNINEHEWLVNDWVQWFDGHIKSVSCEEDTFDAVAIVFGIPEEATKEEVLAALSGEYGELFDHYATLIQHKAPEVETLKRAFEYVVSISKDDKYRWTGYDHVPQWVNPEWPVDLSQVFSKFELEVLLGHVRGLSCIDMAELWDIEANDIADTLDDARAKLEWMADQLDIKLHQ